MAKKPNLSILSFNIIFSKVFNEKWIITVLYGKKKREGKLFRGREQPIPRADPIQSAM
jgi:hypothetical protein